MKRRMLSLLLCVVMTLSMLTFCVFPANAATYNYLFPVKGGRIAYGYGYPPGYGGFHDALDIHATTDDTIYAAYSGVVTETGNACGHVNYGAPCGHPYGNFVRISQDDGTVVNYVHLAQNSILVSTGTRVNKGQPLATMGSSGYSTGKHLHFEVLVNGTKINVNPVSDGGLVNYSYTGYGSIHNCTFDNYEYQLTAHPHKNCFSCSTCGKINADPNSSNLWKSCEQCQAAHTCTFDNYEYQLTAHPHKNCFSCSFCGKINADPNSSNLWKSCEQCQAAHTCTFDNYEYQLTAHPHKNCFSCSFCGKINADPDSSNFWKSCNQCHSVHTWNGGVVTKQPTATSTGIKTYTCTVCSATKNETIPAISVSAVRKFTDVQKKDWYYKAVEYAVNNNLFSGLTETDFGPNENMTRGMFVTVLGRLHGVSVSKKVSTKFVDVKKNQYYTGYVKWANDNNIVSGLTTTTFGPEENINREQICAMMVRYCSYAKITLQKKNAAITFKDGAKISKFARSAVKACQQGGIVNGEKVSGGYNFRPQGNATRAEVATIMMNFAKAYK